MNEAMYQAAMRRIEEITSDEITDLMAAHGMTGSVRLTTRYLTFSREGIPSRLFNEVEQLLTEQLGNRWIRTMQRWTRGYAPKSSLSFMEVAVEDEAAEVMIRLVLPTTIKLESSTKPSNESHSDTKEPDEETNQE